MAPPFKLLFLLVVLFAACISDYGATFALESCFRLGVKFPPLLRGPQISFLTSEFAKQQQQLEEDPHRMLGCLFRNMEERAPRFNKSDLWIGRKMSDPLSKGLPTTFSEEVISIAKLEYMCNGLHETGKYMCARSVEEMVQYATSKLGSSLHELKALQTTGANVVEDPERMILGEVVASKGFFATGSYRSVVCHGVGGVVPNWAIKFVCQMVDKVDYIQATLRSGNDDYVILGQCYNKDSSKDECRWMIQGRIVWILRSDEQGDQHISTSSSSWENAKSNLPPRLKLTKSMPMTRKQSKRSPYYLNSSRSKISKRYRQKTGGVSRNLKRHVLSPSKRVINSSSSSMARPHSKSTTGRI